MPAGGRPLSYHFLANLYHYFLQKPTIHVQFCPFSIVQNAKNSSKSACSVTWALYLWVGVMILGLGLPMSELCQRCPSHPSTLLSTLYMTQNLTVIPPSCIKLQGYGPPNLFVGTLGMIKYTCANQYELFILPQTCSEFFIHIYY